MLTHRQPSVAGCSYRRRGVEFAADEEHARPTAVEVGDWPGRCEPTGGILATAPLRDWAGPGLSVMDRATEIRDSRAAADHG